MTVSVVDLTYTLYKCCLRWKKSSTNLVKVLDRALVRLGLNAKVTGESRCQLLCLGRPVIPQGHIGTGFGHCSAYLVSDASRTPGNNDHTAAHVEHVEDAVGEGRVGATNASHCNGVLVLI